MESKKHCLKCKQILESTKFFPFCSERCKLLDLDGWLNERYKVSRPLMPEEEEVLSGKIEEEDIK